MKKVFSKEILIALTVLLSIGLLYWGLNFLKGINLFTPANFYKVSYKQINGLNVSAPVTINGFQVGLVSDVLYDFKNNGDIIVELSLDKQLKLPVGTEAVIVTDMLGTSTVVLNLNHNASQYCEVGETLVGKVQSNIMENVTNDLMPSITTILPKVDSILTSVNILLSNPALNESITRLNKISYELESLTTNLNNSVTSNLPEIMNNANIITTDLKTISKNLSEISTELNSVPLDSTINNINITMTNLKEITEKLKGNESSLGLLLNDKSLYDNTNETILSMDSLLKDIKENPKRYINIKVF